MAMTNYHDTYSTLWRGTQIWSELDNGILSTIKIKIAQNSTYIPGIIGRLNEKTLLKIASLVDIFELSLLLEVLSNKYPHLGSPTLDIVEDPETQEPLFVEIIFPNGTWEEWGRIVREVKSEMEKAGFKELVSKVAIICLQGLRE
ncbi:hypothetical protein [Pyrococcus horikoshii]|uniref:Uncharacterized protein n=2 Tax=Pyrococcus horikoshii TaxID=53953 RepID=O58142_PYRHO|nr:hypothetical protein [Pyrococcus horikoshii]BAA29480.1 144aa long hypothetical protein [Pyrococcus horikoshii OT3]HII61022.1 hypothetical protein [Pyrococcus horikoshii]